MSTDAPLTRSGASSPPEAEILKAVRELSYGVVEVVVHEGRVTEIRQTRRTRLAGQGG